MDILKNKVAEFYSDNKQTIEWYSETFDLLSQKELVDSSFLSQIVDNESCVQRLSELVLTKHCLSLLDDLNKSKDEGPDITFEFEKSVINIELVTPVKVNQKESKFAVFSPVSIGSPVSRREGTEIRFTPDENSLYPRITGVFIDKCKKFNGYLSKGTVSREDINIICINLGYIENHEYIDFNYLKNLFHKQEIIQIKLDKNEKVSHDILDNDFFISKAENNVFATSYLDEENISNFIDGVWITTANEKSIKNLTQKNFDTHEKAKNILYLRNKTDKINRLTENPCINKEEVDYFINHIRNHKSLPD